ncbi:MAG: DUF2800 domain-containing protein [candidate division Zixibacteria bacterium]|nr:DUF2800 domain-containing protein [candidate division Zixibacteria bacterium]
MNEHSIIPPSSASIWGAPGGCTGWVLMSQQYPETEEGEEAKEGTASHEIAAELIDDNTRGPTVRTVDKFIGKQATNGIVFTEEMYDGAKMYADDVGNVMRDTSIFGGANFGNEQRLTMPRIHELSFGTTDQFIYDYHNGVLYVWDYKFGYLVHEAFENWQTINYVEGIVEKLGIGDQNITVHIRIAQPRAHHRDGPIHEWIVKLCDLRAYFNILRDNAAIALGNNAVIRTGKHCRDCQARHACPAALKAGLGLYEVSMRPTPQDLTPFALGVQLLIVQRAIKQLEYVETGLKEQAKAIIKRGSIMPNYMLENGVGNLAWTKPTAEIIALGESLKIDLRNPKKSVVTPTQAKKLGIDDAVIKAYSKKSNTSLKLVADTGNKAKMFFT